MENYCTYFNGPEMDREFTENVYPIICSKADFYFHSMKGSGFYELGDLISEASIKVVHNLHNYNRNLAKMSTWIDKIVKRTWLDLLDKEGNRKTLSERIKDDWTATHTGSQTGACVLSDPEDDSSDDGFEMSMCSEIETDEDLAIIWDCVESIPNTLQREALKLSIFGYKNGEIAQRLGCTNVAVLRSRARDRVRGKLPRELRGSFRQEALTPDDEEYSSDGGRQDY